MAVAVADATGEAGVFVAVADGRAEVAPGATEGEALVVGAVVAGFVRLGLALCQGARVPASAVPMPTPRATSATAVIVSPTVSLVRLAAIDVTPCVLGEGSSPRNAMGRPGCCRPSETSLCCPAVTVSDVCVGWEPRHVQPAGGPLLFALVQAFTFLWI
ncbi:hypothetical protein Aph02nite_85170 [Actinoplanes philippinensis]|nr:hypothetical protein Aph02nite_85170 [Actinoplanes philippinensis]